MAAAMRRFYPGPLQQGELPPRLEGIDPAKLESLGRVWTVTVARTRGRPLPLVSEQPGKLLERPAWPGLAIVSSQRSPARSGDQDCR